MSCGRPFGALAPVSSSRMLPPLPRCVSALHSRSRLNPAQRCGALPERYVLRQASNADLPLIKQRLWDERMNPTGIEVERFTIVQDSASGQVVAFAQLQTKTPGQCELRSLVVAPDARGSGVGSGLVEHLSSQVPDDDVFITTVSRAKSFYEGVGFRELPPSQMPRWLWFELAAGTVMARVAANERLLIMHRPRRQ